MSAPPPVTKSSSLSVRDVLLQDFWLHLGGLLAFGLGVVVWYQESGFHSDPQTIALGFIAVGLAVNGVTLINGSAASLRNALIAQALAAGQLPADRRQQTVVPGVTVQPATYEAPPPPTSQVGGSS